MPLYIEFAIALKSLLSHSSLYSLRLAASSYSRFSSSVLRNNGGHAVGALSSPSATIQNMRVYKETGPSRFSQRFPHAPPWRCSTARDAADKDNCVIGVCGSPQKRSRPTDAVVTFLPEWRLQQRRNNVLSTPISLPPNSRLYPFILASISICTCSCANGRYARPARYPALCCLYYSLYPA